MTEQAEPCCAKCGSLELTSRKTSFQSLWGVLVYCGACGAVVTWAPKPGK